MSNYRCRLHKVTDTHTAVTFIGTAGECPPVSRVIQRKKNDKDDIIVIKVPGYKAWVGLSGGYAEYEYQPTTIDVVRVISEESYEAIQESLILEGELIVSYPARQQKEDKL